MAINPKNEYSTTVFAAWLNNPRGLKFGPDQFLYVAEGGSGGTNSTVGQCEQVPAPVGPYTGGMTARISKISPQGERTTVVEGLPSNATASGEVSGVADIAFAEDRLYALLAAGGCSHGNPDIPNGLIEISPQGGWDFIVNLSEFLAHHPVENPDLSDPEPGGTWYSLLYSDGAFYAVEPHNGEVDRISLNGEVQRVVDISASQGHIVPMAICVFENEFYVGNLTKFPLEQGKAKILKITKDGALSVFRSGFTNIMGVLLDDLGRSYVLESNVGVPRPTHDKGRVVRVNRSGETETIAAGLSVPTAMTFGPDGDSYNPGGRTGV